MADNKLIQYRCVRCKSLMFKWRTGSEKLEAVGRHARFIDCEDGKKDVVCRKCNTRQMIGNGELKEIEVNLKVN